jgi:isopenicillin-N N-acyltransferase like protein
VTVLRVVRAEGPPAERGRQVGRALGDLIHRSLAVYEPLLGSGNTALLERCRAASERRLPELVQWLDGLAAGAEVDPRLVFAVNAWEEVEQAVTVERCSTFAAVGDGLTLLGHNEMWLPGEEGNAAVVIERPERGPAVASPTLAAVLPAVGLNAHRLAQGVDSLTARDDGPGVPRVLVSRHALDARDRDDFRRRAALDGRSGGYGYVVARPGEGWSVETTAERVAELESTVHTNHYLAPELEELGDPGSASSQERHARLTEALEDRPPRTPEDAMAILSEHSATCDGGGSATVFSMVCELEAGRMWVAPGDPATTPYEEVDVSDVV